MKIRRIEIQWSIVFVFFICTSTTGIAQKGTEISQANVVVIVADDFGWADVGFQGSKFYETPNLDSLAIEGLMFTNGYASCGVCSPSRASLLTGRYTPRSGITDWIRGYQAEQTAQQLEEYKLIGPQNAYNLPSEETTIAEVLKQEGYNTCFVGKWHLGEDAAHYPQSQGFDKNVAGWSKGSPSGDRTDNQSYYTPYNNPYLADGEEGEFLTDRLVDESIQWIDDNKADPFLLYLSFYVVHTPIHPKPEKIPYYDTKALSLGLDTLTQTTYDVDWITNHPNPKWHWKERLVQGSPEYAALIESMDENIGRVLSYLKESGLDENTIIVFTSDNGGLSTAETSPTSNAPLRGGKGWLYEGGIREPFIIKAPGMSAMGEVCDEPVHGIDIYPTIIDACGFTIPNQDEIDGVSLVPLLNGNQLDRDKLFWHYPHYGGKGDSPAGAIRKGDYKLIELFETGDVELYNLKDDISESNDLSETLPEIRNELLEDLMQWRNDVGAELPVANPYYKYKAVDQTSNLNVYVSDTVAINPDLFGVNNDWRFIPDGQFPAFASTCTNLNLGVLRYPGGWESEWLNWSNNTTPGWDKTPSSPGASIATVKSNYTNYSVVVPTQTALNETYNSTAWNNAVESLKSVAKDAIDRAGANNINYVEIGNEWWLQTAGGANRSDMLINYSKTAMNIAGYLAQQYPERKFNILINGDFTQPQEFSAIKQNITEAYNEIDGLALHTYTGYQPPSDKMGYAIQTLGDKIDACARNFNQDKEMIIYCSEWMAARDYNEGRVYMEAANIIPDILQIYAHHGVDAASYWPPVNTTAPGVGLVNTNASVVYPCGQILGDMANSYKGDAVKTVSENDLGIAAALISSDSLLLYVSGKDNPATAAIVNVSGFDIEKIENVEKFTPADYTETDKAAPYLVESSTVNLISSTQLSFDINVDGAYEIFKILLTGDVLERQETELVDFESPVIAEPDFGATFEIVENPDKTGGNGTENSGKIGRTSSLWYELVDIPCSFSIPANEVRYLHIFVKYPAQPDIVLRLNDSGNEGSMRARNIYESEDEWQDIVFEIPGGSNGIDVYNLRYIGDCGFLNSPAGFVLNNADKFAFIDEIIVSNDPSPRSFVNNIPKEERQAQNREYKLFASEGTIHFRSFENKNLNLRIFSINGRLVKTAYESVLNYQVPSPGLYIVQVGNSVEKIVVL